MGDEARFRTDWLGFEMQLFLLDDREFHSFSVTDSLCVLSSNKAHAPGGPDLCFAVFSPASLEKSLSPVIPNGS